MVCIGGSIGKCCIIEKDVCFNQQINSITTYCNINSKYVFYVLLSSYFQIELAKKYKGTATPIIKKALWELLMVPVPPLEEQKRIVAKIEELMPLVEKYGKAQDKLNAINKNLASILKKSILQEAIQGKLVEQRPEEGTAHELYEKIQQEKQKLIVEGKLKKEKSLPEISEDEIPFEIPKSWMFLRLNSVGIWGSGTTPSRSNPLYYLNGTVNWIKTGELKDCIINSSDEKITDEALKTCSLKLYPKNTVVMAMYGATIGRLGILSVESATNQACCCCVTSKLIYFKYLYYYLFASRTKLINMGYGGAQPNISKEKIVNFIIAMPPLEEQKRIVTKIDELFKILSLTLYKISY